MCLYQHQKEGMEFKIEHVKNLVVDLSYQKSSFSSQNIFCSQIESIFSVIIFFLYFYIEVLKCYKLHFSISINHLTGIKFNKPHTLHKILWHTHYL